MPMQVILLERVDNLGNLGDVVTVKPGYARNFLIPQSKALRATQENISYFEARKKDIEKQNAERRKEAEKEAGTLKGLTVTLIRLAAEDGRLYGSVTSRDIAQAVAEASKKAIDRSMVVMNQTFKQLGLFPVSLALHPEVRMDVTINIARSEEEAKIQLKTGKALVAEDTQAAAVEQTAAKESLLDEEALTAEKERQEEEGEKAAKKSEKLAKKAESRASKKALKDSEEDEEGETEEEGE